MLTPTIVFFFPPIVTQLLTEFGEVWLNKMQITDVHLSTSVLQILRVGFRQGEQRVALILPPAAIKNHRRRSRCIQKTQSASQTSER